ncbi:MULTISPECIES: hypothetical protein [Bacillaceae]|uniref:Uncharacterized protein n=1 Tax=Evansella alkalicola TaxID=745819 RepID=A0ABS6JZE3_9BACI|nr:MULTISPECIES: hypothetical protein [Bacillaceae]MBU9723059.1 hypothetical protein [Bacillus alkalicola]
MELSPQFEGMRTENVREEELSPQFEGMRPRLEAPVKSNPHFLNKKTPKM